MSRTSTFALALILTLTATAAQADPLKDATRYGYIVTTHGVWDAR